MLLYRLCFLPCFLVALPYYLFRMYKRGGYGRDFSQRLGNFPELPAKDPQRPRIWLQAVSVGEVLAAGSLIKELKRELNAEIVLTTTTSTGYAQARERFGETCLKVGCFPFDFYTFSRKAWQRIDPDLAITMESELWPEHLQQAWLRKVPLFVVNARLSDRSFRRYQKIGKIAGRLLDKISFIYAGNQNDANRLIKLGYAESKVKTFGNLKFDVAPARVLDPIVRAELRRTLGFATASENEPVVLLGSSTWPGEEALLLGIQQEAISRGCDCRLLLVPRHAERRNEIIKLLEAQTLSFHVRSKGETAVPDNRIYLADTTGELAYLSNAADLAFIGKSTAPNQGGQTPIEAAALALPMIFGPHMENFREITRSLLESSAAIQIRETKTLAQTTVELLQDLDRRHRLSHEAQNWYRRNRGVSKRLAQDIKTKMLG